ncbi:TIGR02217 family protein [Sphingomonas spermidinifaciens]|uniref:TIGR02217 family protein n=1 Tax=Sphingomonas spermidinifaciens TaxID=1141889 RepID=A0A2A4B2W0_9SPHN|nr:DUF2460 domain-containing protein [Sphingomonas spermidinifaciens]PCD01966.1 TIGR02217 family protein [Sphingomonas spermidinifaciens]
MGHWLAAARSVQAAGHLTRFDPRFWTVDFPRPMMASVVTTAPDGLRVDAVFYRKGDLAGLIWDSVDRWDHPLTSYDTDRDYRGCVLSFRWRSGGIVALDAVNGPTLTIEGRDAGGAPRAWYVRLWNYAVGTPEDARVTIDFDALEGGFTLPGEADPVFAGDIDRMFVSLVPEGYVEGSAEPIGVVEGWAELTDMACTGPRSVLTIGECIVPEHRLRIATGYDDAYNQTPARVMRNIELLGYRGVINHYVGMSHYFRLEHASGGLYVSLSGGVLNAPCLAWHRDFAALVAASGRSVIWSLSYELFDEHCWGDWKQRATDGSPALTGWVPPSTLLSPAHVGAMGYLRVVAQAFAGIALEAGLPMRFQVGEPWWWVRADGTPCLYDAAAVAAFGGDPPVIASLKAPLGAAERALLDAAGALLAASTAALCEGVREVAPNVETLLLAYLPTILDAGMPEAKRANLPIGWASPAFDVLQLEDYDWAATGNVGASARGAAAAEVRLNYPRERQHYLSGFVLRPDQAGQWHAIAAAAEAGRARGVAETFVWALPQVLRDGFVHFEEEEDDVQAFDDVRFPLALGREAEVMPETSTAILTSASGHERRNVAWGSARTRYDVGPGVRSETDIAALLNFFRARMGPARAFRLQDPFDHRGEDEAIGTGDGSAMRFPLVRRYGASDRRITRPVAGTVEVRVDGALAGGWTLDPGGWVTFDMPPPVGAAITASFEYDVPVRFAEDRLTVSRATFLAGEAASVPLIEVREA